MWVFSWMDERDPPPPPNELWDLADEAQWAVSVKAYSESLEVVERRMRMRVAGVLSGEVR